MSSIEDIVRRALADHEQLAAAVKPTRGPGRPRKRPLTERVFGMTLRITATMRKRLRRVAEAETEYRGEIVSVHDMVITAIEAELRRRGA